jgi:LysR family glycine cleavage system transcriptional activator
MRYRLPPLNALKAFEAAACHLSFTRAADELHVTQGAVSRHVKQLEDHLGLALFRRLHRSLELTEEGRRLQAACSDAFAGLAGAVEGLTAGNGELRLKVPPTFAIRWLIRRLGDFEAAHPHIRVRLSTANPSVDFSPEEYDAAIVYGRNDQRDRRMDLVMEERLTAVAPPALAGRLKTPADLKRHILLHPTTDLRDWKAWLSLAGLPDPSRFRDQVFDTEDFAIQAAAAGRGVAIANLALVEEDLAAGRLVAPFPELAADSGYHYYLTCLPERASLPKIAAFRDWLRQAAGIA